MENSLKNGMFQKIVYLSADGNWARWQDGKMANSSLPPCLLALLPLCQLIFEQI